jgi:hypothetical protein
LLLLEHVLTFSLVWPKTEKKHQWFSLLCFHVILEDLLGWLVNMFPTFTQEGDMQSLVFALVVYFFTACYPLNQTWSRKPLREAGGEIIQLENPLV